MSNTIVSDHPFTPEEQERLRVLAGLIVPASAEYNVPGADEEPVFADILQSAVAQQAEIKAALAFAGNLDGPLEDNVPLLQTSEVVAPVVVLVMQCYYRADAVLVSLGMEPRPPYPQGYEVEQGDWSMLETVQQRGKIWRDA